MPKLEIVWRILNTRNLFVMFLYIKYIHGEIQFVKYLSGKDEFRVSKARSRKKIFRTSNVNLPSILLRSALWRSGFSSANFLRSTFAQTMNAFIGRRIRCSFRLLWAVLPGWHIFTPAGIGEMPCWYSSDGPEANQDMSSSRCCTGPLNIPGIWKSISDFSYSICIF